MNKEIYDYLIIIIALFLLVYSYSYSLSFKSLPSPLFGGDYYYQLGQIHHMYCSPMTEWFSSSNGLGERPGYFPIFGILITIFGKLFMLSPVQAFLYASAIFPAISLLVFYKMMKEISKDALISFMGALLFLVKINPFMMKYTEFTGYIVFPIFILYFFKLYEKENQKNAILLGTIYGILSLSHSTGFFIGTTYLIAFLLYKLIKKIEKSNKEKELLPTTIEAIKESKTWIIALILGFLIAQIYWFSPIFVYHGESGLKSYLWSLEDYGNREYAIEFAIQAFKRLFFNIKTPLHFILSALSIYSLYWLYKERKLFLNILLLIPFIFTFSYFITVPFFNLHFLPGYILSLYLSTTVIIVAALSISSLKNNKWKYMLLVVILISSIYYFYLKDQELKSNKYIETAQNMLPEKYLSLRQYILEHTNCDDVFLSTNELSFALNAITGRKLVVSRRAQNDAFMRDFDRRQLDAAIIFYGNNINETLRLLKKYNVKYLYYDNVWKDSEYKLSKNGKKVVFDPLMMFYNEEYENELEKYGIGYMKVYYYVDPAVRGEYVRKFDLLVVSQDNYNYEGYGIWKKELDKYLVPVWAYNENNKTLSALYKVKIN